MARATATSTLGTLAACGGGEDVAAETTADMQLQAANAAETQANPSRLRPPPEVVSAEQSPPPPPAVTPTISTAGVTQFLSWDGGSGPTRDFWSVKLSLPWRNRNVGDWLDADLVPQGARPWASASITGGAVNIDVTALVTRWVGSGMNRGFYLRSTQAWDYVFAGRLYADVAKRPQLKVVTDQGEFFAPCLCNAMWTPSSAYGKLSKQVFRVAKSGYFGILQFDLQAVKGRVLSATMTLNCTELRYSGKLELMELDPPLVQDHAGVLPGATVRQGIAQGFLYDQGLASHPDVLFADDFSQLAPAYTGSVMTGSQQVADPASGTTFLRGVVPAGQLLGADLTRAVVRGTASGIPDHVETELYMRYMVYLEEDWGSTVDANKMPGWNGAFGWWNAVGYWQPTTGSGGSPPTGLKVWRNGRWEYQGASMRGHGGTRIGDGNPYDDLFWIGSYIYHLDQASPYGESCRWGGAVLAKKRWYNVEQYIKMNSITGPYDALGNGVAVADGEFKVWVDGVQVFSRGGFRWRRHPEMGIQGVWLNWYHGGTKPTPSTMHFRMNSVVISRSYIGPRREGA